jgi:hypothetical protein
MRQRESEVEEPVWDATCQELMEEMRHSQRVRMHASGVLKHQSVEDGSRENNNHPEGCICHSKSAALGSYERFVDWLVGLVWLFWVG